MQNSLYQIIKMQLLGLLLQSCYKSVISNTAKPSEECDYPVIQATYFDDLNTRHSELQSWNSTTDLEREIPFQFVLVNCTASYPIEWTTKTPQNYYFSYILDDEIRTSVSERLASGTTHDEFSVRLHIGRETFSEEGSNSVSALCGAVDPANCGRTAAMFIEKHNETGEPLMKMSLKRLNASVTTLPTSTLSCPTWRWHKRKSHATFETQIPLKKNMFICDAPLSTVKEGHQNYLDQECGETEQYENVMDFSLHSGLNISSSLSAPTGELVCKSEENDVLSIPYVRSLPKLCPDGDPTLPRLYINTGNISLDEDEFLSLCIQNGSSAEIFVGQNITLTCISSIYYFAQGMQLHMEIIPINVSYIFKSAEHSFGPGGYRNSTVVIHIQSEGKQRVECRAPIRKSTEWTTKTAIINVKVPIQISFDGGTDVIPIISDAGSSTFLRCNATGYPLPSLKWSRLNNGKLPQNQSTLVHPAEPTDTSWISSTLYFPSNDLNLTGYYGRYICTATNKFESTEKMFAVEKSLSEVLLFGSSGTFRNGIWFWIIVAVLVVAIVVLVVLLGWKIQNQSKKLRLFTKAEIDEFIFGNPELLVTDSEDYQDLNSYAAYLPYDMKRFELSMDQLQFDVKDILGSGAYGTVYKGFIADNKGFRQEVAVKTVHLSSDKMYFFSLLSEIKIMCYIGNHDNIVNFIGACTKHIDRRGLNDNNKASLLIYVATEFCENGDLLSYIRLNKCVFESNLSRIFDMRNRLDKGYCRVSDGALVTSLSLQLLLIWAVEISDGLVFLSSRKVIHGDIAARNVLLTSSLVAKIGDFGLSKQLQKYANYVRKDDELVPWRWLAPECFSTKFSLKSDVWAFGIVLFEMFSLGQVPYASYCYSERFMEWLEKGGRLPRPKYTFQKLYNLMLDCWKGSPDDRPTFSSVYDQLQRLSKEWHFHDDDDAEYTRVEERCPMYANVLENDITRTDSGNVETKKLNANTSNTRITISSPNAIVTGYVDWNT